jgi:2-methylcitrate dehydratase PrpD
LRLAAAITIVESPGFNAAFPAQRFAQVSLICQDGTTFVSPVTEPRGDPENHLSSAEINEKFHRLADPILGTHRAHALRSQVAALSDGGETTTLLSLLTEPVA